MIAVVGPLPPPTVDAILAWFSALDAGDLRNALIGAATVGIVGFLLVVGLMALLATIPRRRRG